MDVNNSLKGKVALVTGDSRGIGRAIAEVVVFLAGDAAGWVTGQNNRVNGGIA